MLKLTVNSNNRTTDYNKNPPGLLNGLNHPGFN